MKGVIIANPNCVPSGAICICPMIYNPVCGCDGVMYSNSCLANCQAVAWTPAVPNGAGGFLPCSSSPPQPSWDCISGIAGWTCVDPGTGNGQYSSLNSCQAACVIPSSWDCNGQGACYDPGTGNGQYSSLTACQANCVSTSIISQDIGDLNIYPNPTNGILNIEFSILNSQDIRLNLVNTIGEIVFTESLSNYLGDYKRQINLQEYSKAIYFLEIQTENGTVNKKLILQ